MNVSRRFDSEKIFYFFLINEYVAIREEIMIGDKIADKRKNLLY